MDTLLVICTFLLLVSTNHLTDDAPPNFHGLPMATRNKPSAMFTEYAERLTALDGQITTPRGPRMLTTVNQRSAVVSLLGLKTDGYI